MSAYRLEKSSGNRRATYRVPSFSLALPVRNSWPFTFQIWAPLRIVWIDSGEIAGAAEVVLLPPVAPPGACVKSVLAITFPLASVTHDSSTAWLRSRRLLSGDPLAAAD